MCLDFKINDCKECFSKHLYSTEYVVLTSLPFDQLLCNNLFKNKRLTQILLRNITDRIVVHSTSVAKGKKYQYISVSSPNKAYLISKTSFSFDFSDMLLNFSLQYTVHVDHLKSGNLRCRRLCPGFIVFPFPLSY